MKKKYAFSLVGLVFAAILWLNPILSHSEGFFVPGEIGTVSDNDSVSGGDSGNEDGSDDSVSGGDSGNGDEPGGSVSGGDQPGGDEPGGSVSGGDQPGGDVPGGDEPGGDVPGDDEPGGDEPGGDVPGGDEPGGDEPGGDDSDDTDFYYKEIPQEEVNDALEGENIGEEVTVETESGALNLIKDALIKIVETAEDVYEEVTGTQEVQSALDKFKESITQSSNFEAVVQAIGALDIDISTVYRNAENNEIYTGDDAYGEKPVTQLGEGKKLTFTVKIPGAYYKPDAKYSVVRHHENEDGSIEAEVLDTTQNGDELTFSSNKFSVFIVVMATEKTAPEPTPTPPAETPDEEEEDEDDAPVSAPVEEQKAVVTQVTYVVQRGDNLSKIAAMHGVSLAKILQLNPQIKNPNLIYRGQVIIVDVKTTGGDAAAVAAEYYTVVKGDNLWVIARRYNTTLNSLYEMNRWLLNQKYIYVGQKIRVK